jgi:hypothetical protein
MSEIKTLADQLRNRINEPEVRKEKKKPPDVPAILESLRAFDNREHKSLLHIRFDAQTVKTLNQFKMATGVDVTKFVGFAVQELFRQHPEIKKIIKTFIEQLEL